MHKSQFEKKWHDWRQSVQQKWNKLTDADMNEIDGEYVKLFSHLQKRYGYSKEELKRELGRWRPEKS